MKTAKAKWLCLHATLDRQLPMLWGNRRTSYNPLWHEVKVKGPFQATDTARA